MRQGGAYIAGVTRHGRALATFAPPYASLARPADLQAPAIDGDPRDARPLACAPPGTEAGRNGPTDAERSEAP
jgi:hypothetical protein